MQARFCVGAGGNCPPTSVLLPQSDMKQCLTNSKHWHIGAKGIVLWPSKYAKMRFRPGPRCRSSRSTLPRSTSRLDRGHQLSVLHPTRYLRRSALGVKILPPSAFRSRARKKKDRIFIYSAFTAQIVLSTRSGMDHSFTCKSHHACLSFVSVHQMASLWLMQRTSNSSLLLIIYPIRIKGWVGALSPNIFIKNRTCFDKVCVNNLLLIRGSTAEEATNDIISVQLPDIRRQMDSGQLHVDNIDVFCEQGVFDVDQSRRILTAGQQVGLTANFHGDELHCLHSAEVLITSMLY